MKLLSYLLILLCIGCNESGKTPEFSSTKDLAFAEVNEEYSNDDARQNITSSEDSYQDQKIIKTARLTFETKDPDKTYNTILSLIENFKGIIQNDVSDKGYNRFQRNLVIRIPAKDFQSFIEGISKGVEYFDRREISSQDVTEEFIDINARLKAKRELEERYIQLLKQAKNVKEMLEIERELSIIREEIEARQGRIEYLQNMVSLSTVNIEFYKVTSETGVTNSYGQKAWNSIKGGWDGISVFFLGILYLWPFVILVIIVAWVIKKYFRKKKNKSA